MKNSNTIDAITRYISPEMLHARTSRAKSIATSEAINLIIYFNLS